MQKGRGQSSVSVSSLSFPIVTCPEFIIQDPRNTGSREKECHWLESVNGGC